MIEESHPTLSGQSRNALPLIAVVTLAIALTLAMSGGALARSTFQSSPVTPTDTVQAPEPVQTPLASEPSSTPTVTVERSPSPTAAIESSPSPTAPVYLPPTPVYPKPSAPGYLPPPTLVNPGPSAPGRPSLLGPGDQPPLVGPAVPLPEPTPTPAPAEAPGPAELIDSAIVALGYVWLCCGVLFLVVAALTVVWLARRSRRRPPMP
jgi:hypothetical protein